MARAVTARILGDDYQARFFWLQACRMFAPHSSVTRVGYEWDEIPGFDDVTVQYDPPVPNDRGGRCDSDYFQVKFHVTQDHTITADDLACPAFMGASTSLLQRVQLARIEADELGKSCRFILVTPWQIDSGDLLGRLISNNAGELRLDRLYQGGPKSAMGRLRSAWSGQLGLDEPGLERVLEVLRIYAGFGTLASLNNQLSITLPTAGFKPINDALSFSPYDDLIRKIVRGGSYTFTAEEIKQICASEGLWIGRAESDDGAEDIGIRSFIRRAEYMEDETEAMLDLAPFFSGRNIYAHHLWADRILPEIGMFLEKAAKPGRSYRLHLDTHTSVAMVAGFLLDTKAGVDISPMQKTIQGKAIWRATSDQLGSHNPGWTFTGTGWRDDAADLAVAVSVTHDVAQDVRTYLSDSGLRVRELLTAAVTPAPSSTAVFDGGHALNLVQDLVAELRRRRTSTSDDRIIHMFIAAPNAFTFILGQHSRAIGRCQLYEYDFDSGALGAYEPSICLPPEINSSNSQGA